MSDMESIDRRLDALESENAALKAELDALKNPRRSADKSLVEEVKAILDDCKIPAPIERHVQIVHPAPVSSFKMPPADSLTKLIDAVARRYPALMDTTSSNFTGTRAERRDQWRKNFELCFLAIGNMKRTEHPDRKVYLSFHTEAAEMILKGLGLPKVTLFGHCFQAACLAHFDVPISGIGRAHEGVQVECGLHQYVGRSAGDAYRRILEGEPVREVAVSRPPAPPSQTSVWHY